MQEIVLGIGGMSCQNCVGNVDRVLRALPGVARVEVSLEAARATIDFDPGRVSVNQLKDAVEGAGFDVAV